MRDSPLFPAATRNIFSSPTSIALQLIELKRNPDAGERRVRATLKPFKNSRKDSDEMEAHTRIKVLTEDNSRQRQRLKEVTHVSRTQRKSPKSRR